jgi:hypothetical protein
MFISDPDLDFLPTPDPGANKAPDLGSATLLIPTVPTDSEICQIYLHVVSPAVDSTCLGVKIQAEDVRANGGETITEYVHCKIK